MTSWLGSESVAEALSMAKKVWVFQEAEGQFLP